VELLQTPGLERDALSLSHLTYRCAQLTVNFHRLDHPPFPCTKNISDGPPAVKRSFQIGTDEIDDLFAEIRRQRR